jgi:hypothetical protein
MNNVKCFVKSSMQGNIGSYYYKEITSIDCLLLNFWCAGLWITHLVDYMLWKMFFNMLTLSPLHPFCW